MDNTKESHSIVLISFFSKLFTLTKLTLSSPSTSTTSLWYTIGILNPLIISNSSLLKHFLSVINPLILAPSITNLLANISVHMSFPHITTSFPGKYPVRLINLCAEAVVNIPVNLSTGTIIFPVYFSLQPAAKTIDSASIDLIPSFGLT